MNWLERLLGLFIVGWWIAGLYGLFRAVWTVFGWPIDDINFFCVVCLALFAIVVVWANIRARRLIASVPPDQREAFVRTSHDEMAIW